jgi:hypothetical protein
MSSKQYVVTGACVTHIPVAGPDGQMLVTLYQGAPLPEGVPDDRIKHLLGSNLIEEVGGKAKAEPKKQAKEPDGSDKPKPLNGQSSKPDLVAHAVTQGMTPEDAEKLTRDQLLDMYVRKPAQ